MISNCPRCKSLISVIGPGKTTCRKCGAYISIGDPLKDEPNAVMKETPFAEPVKPEYDEDDDRDDFDDDIEKPKKPVMPVEEPADFSHVDDTYRRNQELKAEELAPKKDSLKGVAWDRTEELGFVEALYQTTRELIFRPTMFFIDMKYVREPKFIPFYGIIFAIIGSLFNTFWALIFIQKILPVISYLFPKNVLAALKVPTSPEILLQIFVAPLITIMFAALVLYGLSALMGSRTKLQNFYRLYGFVCFLDLLYIIPFFGWIIVFIWQSILIIKGLKIINMFPTGRAFMLYLLFLTIMLIFKLPTAGF